MRAVQLEPEHAQAWVGIGNAYHRIGKPDQALDLVEEECPVGPTSIKLVQERSDLRNVDKLARMDR